MDDGTGMEPGREAATTELQAIKVAERAKKKRPTDRLGGPFANSKSSGLRAERLVHPRFDRVQLLS